MKTIFSIFIVCLFHNFASAQDGIIWAKDHPGLYHKSKPCSISGFKLNAIYDVLNQIPFLTHPKGFDVYENVNVRPIQNDKAYRGGLLLHFDAYFNALGKGIIHVPQKFLLLNIRVNETEELMNNNSVILLDESSRLDMPLIFTDTFAVKYEEINGYSVGYVVNNELGRDIPYYVLNPKHKACFIQWTKQQYIEFWIKKLNLDFDDIAKQLVQDKKDYKETQNNETLKAILPQLEKGIKYDNNMYTYYKEKKKYYEDMLAQMTVTEKKQPAYCHLSEKNSLVIVDKAGNILDHFSGRMSYELASDDSENVVPLLMFNPTFFDSHLPKTSIQFILFDGIGESAEEFVKNVQDQFYSNIPYKEIAALMYK